MLLAKITEIFELSLSIIKSPTHQYGESGHLPVSLLAGSRFSITNISENSKPKFSAGFVDTGGKFAAVVVDTGGNFPPVSLTPVANLPPVSTTPVVHLDLRVSPRIFEKFEMILMLLSGAWEKVIHEKNPKQKIS